MRTKLAFFFTLLVFCFPFFGLHSTHANDIEKFGTLTEAGKGTFQETRYLLVQSILKLHQEIMKDNRMPISLLNEIDRVATRGMDYLPDHITNQTLFASLKWTLEAAKKYPDQYDRFKAVDDAVGQLVMWAYITSITGDIYVTPPEWDAPHRITLRADVTDESGAELYAHNYQWYVNVGGRRKIIGHGATLYYIFENAGNHTVFLHVTSNNRNTKWNVVTIPFEGRTLVTVRPKVASVKININGVALGNAEEIKFTPEEAGYGLLFDATSSTPTNGTRFFKTEWDFWHTKKSYDGNPKMERVVYAQEGTYPIKLKLTTNTNHTIERIFALVISKPIATIQASKEEWYIGEKFTFTARPSLNIKNLTYKWKIVDIVRGTEIERMNQSANAITHVFTQKGKYNIMLTINDAAGNTDYDTKIITIGSREPVANVKVSIPDSSQPARVLIDGTGSYDPDYVDEGKLTYRWTIEGNEVAIDNIDDKGAIGYYTFTSIGDKNITLEVTDPDGMIGIAQKKQAIKSILDVSFTTTPRIMRLGNGNKMRFYPTSPHAIAYEWDFWDGSQKQNMGTNTKYIEHGFKKSGAFTVKLTARNDRWETNSFSKVVYVSEANRPHALIEVELGSNEIPVFEAGACNNEWAYVVDRVKPVQFKGKNSINIDGTGNRLTYNWQIGYDKILQTSDATHKFDELGCFPVKLRVTSQDNKRSHSMETWVIVKNLIPTLTSLNLSIQDETTDPVVVNVSAVNPKDPDGVIQQYLWYYYTQNDTDPQDYRITPQPSTTFVIPKINDTYYFVLVMKDNNDGSYSSKESGNEYTLTTLGDNTNTPIITLTPSKNNVTIGEEIIFRVQVRDVLKNDITEKSTFAWDFDGDGVYDAESETPNITHTYARSGTYYAKVRVKHKGMTSTRTESITVANPLQADFSYTSLGDRVIFFNTSSGKYDNFVWDLWDETKFTWNPAKNKFEGQQAFVYEYEDGEPAHTVKLNVYEWMKNSSKTITVERDNEEHRRANTDPTIYIASPFTIENDTITLNTIDDEKIFFYFHPKDEISFYGMDYNIEEDSNIDGVKDNDLDNNPNHPGNRWDSYSNGFSHGGIITVPLDGYKTQTIRFFALDQDENVIESRDISIVKNYITQERGDIEDIDFGVVNESESIILEKLKSEIQTFPQIYRLQSGEYLEQLKAEWGHPQEKTKVIIMFSGFVFDLPEWEGGVQKRTKDNVVDLLESLLVNGESNRSVQERAYFGIVGLIPEDIDGYTDLMLLLDTIYANPANVEENKILWKSFLEQIRDIPESIMDNESKQYVRQLLSSIIYGYDVPEEVQKEDAQEAKKIEGGTVWKILKTIGMIIGGLIGLLVLWLWWLFIFFLLTNKNTNLDFSDFLIDMGKRWWASAGNKPEKKAVPANVVKPPTASYDSIAKIPVPAPVAPKTPTPAPKTPTASAVPSVPPASKTSSAPAQKVENPPAPATPKKDDPFSTSSSSSASANGGEKLPSWLSGNTSGENTAPQPVDPLASPSVSAQPSSESISPSVDPFSAPSGPKNTGLFQDASQENAPDWLKEVVSTDKIVPENSVTMDDPFASSTQEVNNNTPSMMPGNMQTSSVSWMTAFSTESQPVTPFVPTPSPSPLSSQTLSGQALPVANIPTPSVPPTSQTVPVAPVSQTPTVSNVTPPKQSPTPTQPPSASTNIPETKVDDSIPDWLRTDTQSATSKPGDFWTLDANKTT